MVSCVVKLRCGHTHDCMREKILLLIFHGSTFGPSAAFVLWHGSAMNSPIQPRDLRGKALGAAALASLLLAGCAGAPVVPQGAADARTKLTRLQSDPNLDPSIANALALLIKAAYRDFFKLS